MTRCIYLNIDIVVPTNKRHLLIPESHANYFGCKHVCTDNAHISDRADVILQNTFEKGTMKYPFMDPHYQVSYVVTQRSLNKLGLAPNTDLATLSSEVLFQYRALCNDSIEQEFANKDQKALSLMMQRLAFEAEFMQTGKVYSELADSIMGCSSAEWPIVMISAPRMPDKVRRQMVFENTLPRRSHEGLFHKLNVDSNCFWQDSRYPLSMFSEEPVIEMCNGDRIRLNMFKRVEDIRLVGFQTMMETNNNPWLVAFVPLVRSAVFGNTPQQVAGDVRKEGERIVFTYLNKKHWVIAPKLYCLPPKGSKEQYISVV